MKIIIMLFAGLGLCLAACNNSTTTKKVITDSTTQEPGDQQIAIGRKIQAGDTTFNITDSLVGNHIMMGTYTMSEYFTLTSDSISCSLLVTGTTNKMDELITYDFARTDIDITESYTEGISYGDKNAMVLVMFAKPGQKINGMHYNEDGNGSSLSVEKVEISFDNREKAQAIATSLGIK